MGICAELVETYLKEKDLNFNVHTDSDGDTVIDFPFQGKVTKLIFSGDDSRYLSIYLVYERAPEDKYADAIFVCNELNSRYKWITFYVDKDQDIVLHDDAILSAETAADETFELLLRMLKISDEVKPVIMKALYA